MSKFFQTVAIFAMQLKKVSLKTANAVGTLRAGAVF